MGRLPLFLNLKNNEKSYLNYETHDMSRYRLHIIYSLNALIFYIHYISNEKKQGIFIVWNRLRIRNCFSAPPPLKFCDRVLYY